MTLYKDRFFNPDDDFTGSDGSAPDSTRWTETDASNKLDIQSNTLDFDSQEATDTEADVTSVYKLTGDFDFQVDVNELHGSNPASATHFAYIQILGDSGDNTNLGIGRNSSDGQEWWASGSSTSWDDVSRTGTTNTKLRLTRSGTTIKVFYWNPSSSQWEWDGNTVGKTMDESHSSAITVKLRLKQVGNGSTRWHTAFDNFTVNSAEGLIPPRFIHPDDDFTGDDGSAPHSGRWNLSGSPTIQGNRLELSVVGSGTQEDADSAFTLTGDFDVQVDFDTTGHGTGTGTFTADLQVWLDADDTYRMTSRWRYDGTNREYVEGHRTGGTWTFSSATVTTDTTGKFRITRSGSDWSAYYWGGASWTQIGSTQTIGAGAVKIGIQTYNWGSDPNLTWWADNFRVNSADGISPADTFTLSSDALGIQSPAWLDWIDPDDDFTGDDGDALNTDRWTEDDSAGNMEIQSNKLDYDGTEAALSISSADTAFELQGDFDVQVDYEIISADSGRPSSSYHRVDFRIEDGSSYVMLAATYDENSVDDVDVVNGTATTWADTARTQDSGKWRITRSGSVIKGYRWNGSQWEWNGSTDGFTYSDTFTGDVFVRIRFVHRGSSVRFHATIDNFVVNSADGLILDDAPTPWAYRYPITIDSSKIDSDLTDFPILVHLGDSSGAGNKDVTSVFTALAPPSSVNDDFTGADGDSPDPSLWIETDASNKLNIQSNALEIDSQESTDIQTYVQSRYNLSGDFDVQVDIEELNGSNPSSGGHLSYLVLSFGGGIFCNLGIARNSSGRQWFSNGSSTSYVNVSRGINSSKLRFTRSGSTITGYYWSGSQWEWDGSTSGRTMSESTTADLAIRIQQKQEGDGTTRWNAAADNFTLNSGTVVWPYSTFPNRKRIAFADKDGTTQLYGEIEKWTTYSGTTATDSAWLWTKVPTVSSETDTLIYLYYDNTNGFLDNTAYIGDTGETPAQNVWDANYAGVWHMTGASATAILDSTSNDKDVTADVGDPTYEADGQVGDGVMFDGSDALTVGTFGHSDNVTIQAAMSVSRLPSVAGSQSYVVAKDDSVDRSFVFRVRKNDWSTATYDSYQDSPDFGIWKSGTDYSQGIDSAVTVDTPFLMSGVNNGTDLLCYKNDESPAGTGNGWGGAFDSDAADLEFGRAGNGSNYVEGTISEVRISHTARSAAWIKADYYSTFDNLVTFGSLSSTVLSLHFSNPYPVHLSTVYGLSHYLKTVVTASGVTNPEVYSIDVDFYDGASNKIGSTVSGTSSGEQTTSSGVLTTTSGGTYSWYAYAISEGVDATSSTYTFTNKFLCQGTTTVNGTGISGIPVRLYKRDDGSLVGSTTSAGVSGTFSIESDYNEYHYAVAIHTSSGTNALIHDWLKPGE